MNDSSRYQLAQNIAILGDIPRTIVEAETIMCIFSSKELSAFNAL